MRKTTKKTHTTKNLAFAYKTRRGKLHKVKDKRVLMRKVAKSLHRKNTVTVKAIKVA